MKIFLFGPHALEQLQSFVRLAHQDYQKATTAAGDQLKIFQDRWERILNHSRLTPHEKQWTQDKFDQCSEEKRKLNDLNSFSFLLIQLEPLRNFLLFERAVRQDLNKHEYEHQLPLCVSSKEQEMKSEYQMLLQGVRQKEIASSKKWIETYQKWRQEAFECAHRFHLLSLFDSGLSLKTKTKTKTKNQPTKSKSTRKRKFDANADLEEQRKQEERKLWIQKQQKEQKKRIEKQTKEEMKKSLGLPIHIQTGKYMTPKQFEKEQKCFAETKEYFHQRAMQEFKEAFELYDQQPFFDEHLVSTFLPAIRRGLRFDCRFKEDGCSESHLQRFFHSQRVFDFKKNFHPLMNFLNGQEVNPKPDPFKEKLFHGYIQSALFLCEAWCKEEKILLSQLTKTNKQKLTKGLMYHLCQCKKGPFEAFLSFFKKESDNEESREFQFQTKYISWIVSFAFP